MIETRRYLFLPLILNFLKSCARDSECNKKMEQCYLECSAFATVILRAKDASTAAFDKLF